MRVDTPPTPAALAAKEATQTIPIMFGAVGDPVHPGLVNGLAHPAGNVTGISNLSASLFPKRVELLRESCPARDGSACSAIQLIRPVNLF
jgi:putative tryptophan/tyrosine transport system substrate-binding protein